MRRLVKEDYVKLGLKRGQLKNELLQREEALKQIATCLYNNPAVDEATRDKIAEILMKLEK